MTTLRAARCSSLMKMTVVPLEDPADRSIVQDVTASKKWNTGKSKQEAQMNPPLVSSNASPARSNGVNMTDHYPKRNPPGTSF